ncbi:MAG: hypothetical protein JEY71_16435 [Sphaerochaeta sp.]|nr:hypothetical protein [Sphaerochaeta sp.]
MKSMKTIETGIAQAKEMVLKSKARHEATIAKNLFDAFKKSGKSYDAVMRFLKEGLG